jgi:hypothetical protein
LEEAPVSGGCERDLPAAALKRIAYKAAAERMLTLEPVRRRRAAYGPHRNGTGAHRGPVAVMSFDPTLVIALRQRAPHLVRGIAAKRHYRTPHWDMLRGGGSLN